MERVGDFRIEPGKKASVVAVRFVIVVKRGAEPFGGLGDRRAPFGGNVDRVANDALTKRFEEQTAQERRFSEPAIRLDVLPSAYDERGPDDLDNFELLGGKFGKIDVRQDFAEPARRVCFEFVSERKVGALRNRADLVDLFPFFASTTRFVIALIGTV